MFSTLLRFVGTDGSMSCAKGSTRTGRPWCDVTIEICEMSPLVFPHQMSTEGKGLGDHLFDILEYFSLTKEYTGIGWCS